MGKIKNSKVIRCSEKFVTLLYRVKAKRLMDGIKPPSEIEITDIIAEKLMKDEKWQNEFFL